MQSRTIGIIVAVLLVSIALPIEGAADLVSWDNSRFLHFGSPDNVDWLWYGGNHTADVNITDWYMWEMGGGQNITITIFHQYMVPPMVGIFVSIYEDTSILGLHLARDGETRWMGALFFPEDCNATTVQFTAKLDATYHLGVALYMEPGGVREGASYVIKATRELEYLGPHGDGWVPEEPFSAGVIFGIAIIACAILVIDILYRKKQSSR